MLDCVSKKSIRYLFILLKTLFQPKTSKYSYTENIKTIECAIE